MTIHQLIDTTIIPLKLTDIGDVALHLMDELKVTQLPVVKDNKYVGSLSESDILNHHQLEQPISLLKGNFQKGHIKSNQHIYDVLDLFQQQGLSVLAVVDEKGKYLGAITPLKIVHQLAKGLSANHAGSIIVLEMTHADYSLVELAQIVESHHAKIMSLFILSLPNTSTYEVTLKINTPSIEAILHALLRYNYTISSYYSTETLYEGLQERYEAFLKYLHI